MANYDGVALLKDCLDSIFAQSFDAEFEVIIHDDASSDDSVSWLLEHYPNIELLASQENVGFCISNNRMAAHARGEYLLLLNNDAALHPGALTALLNVARKQDPAGIVTLPQYDWESGTLVDRGCLIDPFYNPIPNLDSSRQNVAMVIGACLLLPRTLWSQLGGFPEWFGSIGEDLYLCCQARLRGFPVQVATDSGYRHRQGASFGGNRATLGQLHTTYRRRALSERNKTYTLMVMTPSVFMWPLLALHLIVLALEGMVLSLLKSDRLIWSKVYWPSMTSLASSWSELRKQRRHEQIQRRIALHQYMKTTRMQLRKLSMLWRHGIPKIS
ncbi:MAG TPA: glycosyltransferase [Candidatus Saccharimonadales bacterium]|nr:glycosyltransferase [Candidatus Saccharimonadales bacterium]